MSSQPVYRRPRSHSYACRCPKCTPQGGVVERYGIIGPLAVFGGIAFLIGFWPALVWHGYTDTGGWRWDIHSTIGVLAYWGVIAFLAFLVWIGNSLEKTAPPPRLPEGYIPPPAAPPAAPACRHRGAVPVDHLLGGKPWAYWCEECGTQLDPDSRLPMPAANPAPRCCGAPPGAGHWGNCPRRKG